MSVVAAFVLGVFTCIVGIVVFVGPHLRGLRDERIELRKANNRLTDRVRDLSRGTEGEDWLEAGVKVQPRRGTSIPDDAIPLELPHGTYRVDGEVDGVPVVRFDDIRDG